MIMKTKLYVNNYLKAEDCTEKQVAIVNILSGQIEIAFLRPIAKNQLLCDSQSKIYLWGKEVYPMYSNVSAPHVQTCLLANKNEKTLVFRSCCTCTQELDFDGRVRFWTALDQKGRQISADSMDRIENIYPAILLSKEDLLLINPSISFEEYLFYDKDYSDPFLFAFDFLCYLVPIILHIRF